MIELRGNDAFGRNTGIAIVKAPRVLPRIIKMPQDVAGEDNAFVMLSSVLHAHLLTQRGMNALPSAIVAKRSEVAPDGRPGRKVMRQGTPLAPRAVHIEDGIDHFAHVDASRTPACLGRRDQRLQDSPLPVGEIAGVPLLG